MIDWLRMTYAWKGDGDKAKVEESDDEDKQGDESALQIARKKERKEKEVLMWLLIRCGDHMLVAK